MGRHALPDRHGSPPTAPRPPGPADGLLGWGTFATVLAVALDGWRGHGWPSALLVAALGGGATAALWIAARLTHRDPLLGDPRLDDRDLGAHDSPTGGEPLEGRHG